MFYSNDAISTGPNLVPDPNTSAGRDVQRLQNLMADINVRLLTFGVIANQELSINGVKMPRIFLKIISGIKNYSSTSRFSLFLDAI